eukprot:3205140-Prymnesium_polylepis.1
MSFSVSIQPYGFFQYDVPSSACKGTASLQDYTHEKELIESEKNTRKEWFQSKGIDLDQIRDLDNKRGRNRQWGPANSQGSPAILEQDWGRGHEGVLDCSRQWGTASAGDSRPWALTGLEVLV